MRDVSERTVRRDWEKARLLLYRTILPGLSPRLRSRFGA